MGHEFLTITTKLVVNVMVAAYGLGGIQANSEYTYRPHPRHCLGSAKHLHLAVGRDPAREMTVSFASKWSSPDVIAPIAGVHIGLKPNNLDRFVKEKEYPRAYESNLPENKTYYAPFQHHIEIDGLEPSTTYYYVAVLGEREEGIEKLKRRPLRDHPTQHLKKLEEQDQNVKGEEDGGRLRRNRRLVPPYYDGADKQCIEGHRVRSFSTAPEGSNAPVSFAIVGDMGQFEHSQETLVHMRDNKHSIDAVILAGDIAYTAYDHRRWDTFFDFLDDFSIFDEVPLHIATGNHGKTVNVS